MPGAKNWDQAAGIIWPVLTAAAHNGTRLTYGDIAPLIPTNPLSVGFALGRLQTYCLEARLPPITVLVVGKSTGVPGAGFIAWDIDTLEDAFEAVFRFNWTNIANPFIAFAGGATEAELAQRLLEAPGAAAEVYTLVKDRGVVQRVFRRALLIAYKSRCCMCGLSFERALQAAHIISWRESTPKERMDVRNGLLLCANHHALFDANLLSVRPDHVVEYSDPQSRDGPYTAADQMLSAGLHGQVIDLPTRAEHAPDSLALSRRRHIGGWD